MVSMKKIAIIQGHPDAACQHYCHALAEAYQQGAEAAGNQVKRIDIAKLDFPLLRTKQDFETSQPPVVIQQSQKNILWADHLVIIYPLWLGTMPALLKAYLEQVFRPGFAFSQSESNKMPLKMLHGKSARIIVTMGMPAPFYRWYYRAHGLKNLQRNILLFAGIRPVRTSLIGMVEASSHAQHQRWLNKIIRLGAQAK